MNRSILFRVLAVALLIAVAIGAGTLSTTLAWRRATTRPPRRRRARPGSPRRFRRMRIGRMAGAGFGFGFGFGFFFWILGIFLIIGLLRAAFGWGGWGRGGGPGRWGGRGGPGGPWAWGGPGGTDRPGPEGPRTRFEESHRERAAPAAAEPWPATQSR